MTPDHDRTPEDHNATAGQTAPTARDSAAAPGSASHARPQADGKTPVFADWASI